MKKSLALYALVVVTAIFVSGYFKPNVFEINDLHQIARNAVGKLIPPILLAHKQIEHKIELIFFSGIHPIEQAFNNVTLELMKRYNSPTRTHTRTTKKKMKIIYDADNIQIPGKNI